MLRGMNLFVRRVALTLIFAASTAASHAISVSFSGGNGANLSITFNEAIDLTLTANSTYVRLVFDGLYSPTSDGLGPISNLSYTINGGTDPNEDPGHTLYDWNLTNGAQSPDDYLFTVSSGTTNSGSVYHFASGQTVTTTGGWANNPAAFNPTFQIFLADLFGNRVSAVLPGTISAVPEPATYAGLAGLASLGFVAYRRRRS